MAIKGATMSGAAALVKRGSRLLEQRSEDAPEGHTTVNASLACGDRKNDRLHNHSAKKISFQSSVLVELLPQGGPHSTM